MTLTTDCFFNLNNLNIEKWFSVLYLTEEEFELTKLRNIRYYEINTTQQIAGIYFSLEIGIHRWAYYP